MTRRRPRRHCRSLLTPIAVSLLLALPAPIRAQNEALITDRPDFTESTASVRPGRVQIEAGYTFEDLGDQDAHTLGETLLRVGLTELAELRIELPSHVELRGAPGAASGLGDSSIGFKLETAGASVEPRFLEPAMALVISTTLPTGDAALGEPHLQPSVLLALDWAIGERWGVGSNIGLSYTSSGGEQFAEALVSLAVGVDLGRDWGGFVEYYAFHPESSGGDPQHFVDGGVTYLISDDFQLDARLGGAIEGETDFFAGVGLAYRW